MSADRDVDRKDGKEMPACSAWARAGMV